jgi:hypothetical protein
MVTMTLDEKYWLYLLRKLPNRPPAILEIQANEVLKYLYLVSLAPRPGIPILVTAELDDIWHYLILETRAYAQLCKSLPSGQFLNHTSNSYPSDRPPEEPEALIQFELLLYANYVYIFGGFTNDTVKYWPGVVRLMQAADLTNLESLNAYLVAIAHTEDVKTTGQSQN